MKRLVFDIETNGLLPEVSTLHVCCTRDLDTGDEWYSTNPLEIISHLSKATHLIGHNIIDYDLPVLDKLLNWKPDIHVQITDTVILSRLGNPDRTMPSNVPKGSKFGSHSLAAWGYRVGRGKVDHEDWTTYSNEMLHRCQEDVRITELVYKQLLPVIEEYGESVAIEHEVQRIISKQERDGVYFNTELCKSHIETLSGYIKEIDLKLTDLLPSKPKQVGTTVQKPFKKDGSLSKLALDWGLDNISGPFSRVEFHRTDLNSDSQVKTWLLSIGWKPTEFNRSATTGEQSSPKLTEDSFETIPGEVGELLKQRVTWRHRRSQIEGWLSAVREDHCLPAGANTLGTNTGRMRHRCVVNVPKADDSVPFGHEMRELFCARPGRKFVGYDASGLELRMLAHYMNDPEYTEQILNGDIHSYNQRLAGLPTRNSAKTFIYALLYGAGDAKLGSIIGGGADEGSKLRHKFFSNLPKFGKLIDDVKRAAQRGYLKGLDGRRIVMRRDDRGEVMVHKALNTLLQSAGAQIMKKAMVIAEKSFNAAGLDYIKVIDMHDESQLDVFESHAELIADLAVQSIIDAGSHFKLNIPLAGEAKIGNNWAETH